MSDNFNYEIAAHRALSECDRLIKHFDSHASRHKKFFKSLSVASIILAASVTALAGIADDSLRVVTTVVAALSTIAASILAFSQAQNLWVISRSTSQKLVAEKFLFMQQAKPYHEKNSEQRVLLFSERVIKIWNEGHASWQEKAAGAGSSPDNLTP